MTDQFIKERLYLKGVSPKTIAWYKDSFKAFNGALDNKSTILTRIAELRDKGVKPVSVNTWLRCINAYFRWLHVEHGKPLLKIPKLKEEQKILATLSEQQIISLLRLSTHSLKANLRRAHLIALTILDCGLRAAEVTGLTKEQVDLDNLVFNVHGKGGKQRLVPFSTELRKALFKFINQNRATLVFGTKNDTKLSVRNLERDFKILGQKLGITARLNPHGLRHCFAINYLRNGGDLFTLSRILGHTSISTTQIYLRSMGIDQIKETHAKFSPLCQMHRSIR